jgi:guanylate kinase
LAAVDEFGHVIVNDRLEAAVADLLKVLEARLD